MLVIGILGGIGSGKSTVSAMFEKLGALRVDADKLAHEVLAEPGTISKIKDAWGEAVLSGGGVDRKKLAEAAFSSREEADRLNAIIHPGVILRINEEVDRARAGDLKAFGREHQLEALPQSGVVVHHQDPVRHLRLLIGRSRGPREGIRGARFPRFFRPSRGSLAGFFPPRDEVSRPKEVA